MNTKGKLDIEPLALEQSMVVYLVNFLDCVVYDLRELGRLLINVE